mgnify:CR=1 FL=1
MSESQNAAPAPNRPAVVAGGISRRRKRNLTLLTLLFIAVALAFGLAYFLVWQFEEKTEDAYVAGHVVQITPRIGGTVRKVSVDDTDIVKKDDVLMTLDDSDYEAVDDDANAYLLAQNKLWVVTGEAANFTDQITALVQQSQSVQAQLGSPAQITAPQTGYFVRSSSSGRLNASADDILALNAQELQGYLQSDPVLALDGCAGKIVAGFTWRYVGVCTAKQGEKLLGQNGKPLSTAVEISFPGQVENSLKATVTEVEIDQDSGLARFVLACNSINGDVLCLNRAAARISVGERSGLRVPAAAVHYLKEDGTEAETQGENYIPGVYVKYGNIARFCKIDPVDADHPLISEDDYILVLPKGTDGSVSQVRLYDEIIVSGQNLYDGKLL